MICARVPCRWLPVVIALLPVCLGAKAQPLLPGNTYFSPNGHIEYRCGDLPLIVSVPHGGSLEPVDIPDRTCNSPVYDVDANTVELSLAIDSAFQAHGGCRPHLIINHLARRKLDANRNLTDGACGDPQAVLAWNAFHDFIDSASATATALNGKGFYLDLHGHGHAIQRVELGYLLYEDELALPPATLNSSTYINYSSIRNLAGNNQQGLTHAQLLQGQYALGTLLANAGYPAVPGQQDPFPLAGQPYFSGGYNVAQHSSYSGGTIDGVQVECYYTGIRGTAADRSRFADSLVVVIEAYFDLHYFAPGSTCTTGIEARPGVSDQRVFPNPATANVSMAWPAGTSASVRVNDLLGRVWMVQRCEGRLDITGLPAGMYTISAVDLGFRATFVKE